MLFSYTILKFLNCCSGLVKPHLQYQASERSAIVSLICQIKHVVSQIKCKCLLFSWPKSFKVAEAVFESESDQLSYKFFVKFIYFWDHQIPRRNHVLCIKLAFTFINSKVSFNFQNNCNIQSLDWAHRLLHNLRFCQLF